MGRSVLISGASTGIGAACVSRLASSGWTVFAGVRRERDGDALVAGTDGDVRPLILDVSDHDQVEQAVAEVRSAIGTSGLHGLVNNAGIGLGGPVELVPLDDWRRQFEVNLFGAIALTQVAFGLVRAAGGRFVYMGSTSGRVSNPGVAPYAASKHALAAVCESMRHELAGSEMQVSLVEPGVVRTPIWDKTDVELRRIDAMLDGDRRRDYGSLIHATRAFSHQGATKGIAPDAVAEVVEHALTARRPKARYLVGPDARVLGGIISRLPDRARDRLVGAAVRQYVRRGRKLPSGADATS